MTFRKHPLAARWCVSLGGLSLGTALLNVFVGETTAHHQVFFRELYFVSFPVGALLALLAAAVAPFAPARSGRGYGVASGLGSLAILTAEAVAAGVRAFSTLQ